MAQAQTANSDTTPPAISESEARAAGRVLIERVEGFLPAIRERAAETETLGRVPDASVAELVDAGVFRAVAPREWGGTEMDPASYYEAMIRIGSACGSTGWMACLVSVHAWQVALFSPEMHADFWSTGPDTRASSSYMPVGKVESVGGGFRLSGRWGFSSGVDHCQWVILGSVVRDAGEPEFRSFLVPAEDFTIDQDSWNVSGLAGSGSKDVIVDNAFVPEYRTHRLTDVYAERDPGFAVNDRPLYRLPWLSVFYGAIAASAMGAATGALDVFLEDAKTRVSPLSGMPAAANPYLHARLAKALGDLDAVRTRSRRTWDEMYAYRRRGEQIPRLVRTRGRFESADAIATSFRVAAEVYEVAGGASIHSSKPLQRFFRDLMAMRNHPCGVLEPIAGIYARERLGIPPEPFDASKQFSLSVHC